MSYEKSCFHCALLTLLFCLPFGSCKPIEADAVTEFTLHTTMATWPEARNTCMSTGGVLLNLEDSYKISALSKLLSTWAPLLSPSNYSVWIGFYDVLPPHQRYKWTNSCEIVDPSSHGYSFNNTSADMRCGASHGVTSTWRIENCTQKKMFICERRTDLPCDYTIDNNRYIIDGDPINDPNGTTTAAFCNAVCLPNPLCWAAYLATFLKKGCIFYLAADPSGLQSAKKFALSKKLYIKECIQAKVVNSSNNSIHNSSFPDECAEEHNMTTTEISTSSPASSTMSSAGITSVTRYTTTTGFPATTEASGTLLTTTLLLGSTVTASNSEPPTIKLLTDPSATTDVRPKTLLTVPPLISTIQPVLSTIQTPLSTAKLTITDTISDKTDCNVTSGTDGILDNCSATTTGKIKAWVGCPCSCSANTGFLNLTEAEKELFVLELLKSLTVNKSALSSTRRRLTSADDKRPSARYMGGLGIAMICLVGCTILAMDLDKVIKVIHDKYLWATKRD